MYLSQFIDRVLRSEKRLEFLHKPFCYRIYNLIHVYLSENSVFKQANYKHHMLVLRVKMKYPAIFYQQLPQIWPKGQVKLASIISIKTAVK